MREHSAFQRLITKSIDSNRVDVPPPPVPSRELVDLPNHRETEFKMILEAFQERLDALTEVFERSGAGDPDFALRQRFRLRADEVRAFAAAGRERTQGARRSILEGEDP